MENKEYFAELYLKNADDLQEYLNKLTAKRGSKKITIEEAMQFNFKWGSKNITN